MGLSITSSAPKGGSVNLGNLTGTTPDDAAPGDFLALLTSELGNFILSPDTSTTQTIEKTSDTAEDTSLSRETTESIIPQVDPALLATLSAAKESATPQVDPALLVALSAATQGSGMNQNTTPVLTEGVSKLISNKSKEASASDAPTPSLMFFPPQTPAGLPTKTTLATDKTEIAAQTWDISPEQPGQKPISLDIGKSIPSHQAISPDLLKTAAELPSTQIVSNETASLSNTIPATSPTPLHSKPVSHSETELATHIQEKVWPQQFGEKIVWMAKSDIQSAQINLNPPELGPIQITLNLSGDQAKLSFASPHLEVRQSIESALPQLKEMLSSSGISLGQANVGSNLQQQPRDTLFQGTNERHRADENAILSGNEATIAVGSSTSTQRGRGLVDLFA